MDETSPRRHPLEQWEVDLLARYESLFAAGRYHDLAREFCHEGWAGPGINADRQVGVCSFLVPDGPDAPLVVASELLRRARSGEMGC